MAIFRGPMGQFKNKLGNMVTCTIEGDSIARALPLNVKNPSTPKQVEQRTKFKLLLTMAQRMKQVCNLTFSVTAKRVSGMNHFMSRNLSAVSVNELGVATLDFDRLVVGEGRLPSVNGSISLDDLASEMTFTLNEDSQEVVRGEHEELAVVLVHKESLEHYFEFVGKLVDVAPKVLSIPNHWTANEMEVYWVVVDQVNRTSSPSCHIPQGA